MIVDVALVAALEEEYEALAGMLKGFGGRLVLHRGHSLEYRIATYTNLAGDDGRQYPLSVVLLPPTDMGQLNAATAIGALLRDLHIKVVLLGGIAGCLLPREEGEGCLGDIVIATKIIDYELEKIAAHRKIPRETSHLVARSLIGRIQNQVTNLRKWPDLPNILPQRSDGREPQVLYGEVYSGNQVIASDEAKQGLRIAHDKAIAIEMEAAGIAAMLRQVDLPERFLMVKVFSDWADDKKDDDSVKAAWRRYASQLSAAFIGFLLRKVMPEYVHTLREQDENQHLFEEGVQRAFRSFFAGTPTAAPHIEQMARAICNGAVKEICALAAVASADKEPYKILIGSGPQFLLRADPLFANASRIYATSLDRVSTFWIDPHNRRIAKQYIDRHGRKDAERTDIMRLFVFSTPDSAHAHSQVLDYHCQRFPNTFVCTLAAYEELLPLIAPSTGDEYTKRDFALLEFPDTTTRFFAGLDAGEFTLGEARLLADGADVDVVSLAERFISWSDLVPGAFDRGSRVLKWAPKYWKESQWGETLRTMFGEPTADIFHIVTFNLSEKEYRELRPGLADLKRAILSDWGKKHGVKDVWLTKLVRGRSVVDPVSGGKLWYEPAESMSYAFLMRFVDRQRLDDFMRDEKHLERRLRLFHLLDGQAKDLMNEFDIATPADLRSKDASRAKVLYEALEALAAGRMRRYDYCEDELIEELVAYTPPPF